MTPFGDSKKHLHRWGHCPHMLLNTLALFNSKHRAIFKYNDISAQNTHTCIKQKSISQEYELQIILVHNVIDIINPHNYHSEGIQYS